MKYQYRPRGVCSHEMNIEIDGNIIKSVQIIDGCDGNTKGIASLLVGMDINEAIKRLKGIDCGGRGTSCPDQLSRALEEMKANM